MMFKKIISLAIITIITVLMYNSSIAQEVKIEVTINVEQLQFEARTYISSMKRDIENYVNNQKFTEIEWEGDPIAVQMTIYLSGGTNNIYSAKMFLVSMRDLDGSGDRRSVNVKFYEDKWSFEYSLGANLTYSTLRFDKFASLIDYYMLLVIGFDMDTYGELDGNRAFQDARRIVEMGSSNNAEGYSTYSSPGDFTKSNLTSELTDMRYDAFRKLVFVYYVDGLDLMAFEKDNALKNLKDVIYDFALFKKEKLVASSVLMQLFFDSKAQEIASIFNGYEDVDVFDNLKYVDPSNSTLYDEAQAGTLGR